MPGIPFITHSREKIEGGRIEKGEKVPLQVLSCSGGLVKFPGMQLSFI